ncbi:NAD(P)-binding protein [Tothia fuscella]|uniref:NAD(P)-binding protein n=1 Tax=Tothia fuscella TaxID=1048955 RepID=A0A9P4TSC1_9PEZI|nr:NAD(P)-binding protein [Tothia fuscella]
MASTTRIFHHTQYPTISPTNPANDQAGKTVLITGASRGIGYAIAKAFIQANAYQVILTGHRQESLDRAVESLAGLATNTLVKTYVCDLSDENSIEILWQRLGADHVEVNVLILNAAESASGPANPVGVFLQHLRAAFDFNLFANAAMTAQFLACKPDDEADTAPNAIINISSFMAHSNPAPQQTAYSTSKAAFAHTLQLLADEIPSEQCQIVNLHPGAILTESAKNAPQEVKDAVLWDEAELPAAYTVWASTKEAAFLHGRFVWANWDVDELIMRKEEFKNPGFLRLGLQGSEFVDIRTIFDEIRRV